MTYSYFPKRKENIYPYKDLYTMFISALLKTGNNISPSTGEHIKKLWDTNLIEYYSAI